MLHFKENQIIAGKYKLERQFAKGGMGAVWTARNLQLNIPVAVKFMAPEAIDSPELVARFEREARAAAQLRSPHVVHIYEHGVVHDTPFMVMELLEGEDLSKRLRTRGRLSMAETTRIGVDVCKALRRAHEQNIVHRDLKPGNVFLCRQDEDEIVKVLDFGIAKILVPGPDDEVTKTGALVGTPHYMSPEQARRTQKDVDHRTDLWALGVIAFRALTGRLPFAGETAFDVILRVCSDHDPIPVPSSIAPDLGPEVDRFFARALARRPEERFQSAREMAEAMSALSARSSGAAAHPLGQSWAESGPHPTMAPRVPTGAPPVQPPAAPSVHMAEAKVYTSAAAASPRSMPAAMETHDPLGIATTVPIARSAVGQALLRGAQTPARTLPLDIPVAAVVSAPSVQPPPRAGASGGWPAQTGGGPAAMAQAAGDVAGTITSAATETSSPVPPRRRQSSWIVWVVAAAAALVVGVVGWAVVTGLQQPEESMEAADAPPIIPLPVVPPTSELSAAPAALLPSPVVVVASASASASASVAPKASTTVPRPTTTVAVATSAKPTATATPSGQEKRDSGMMAPPKF